MKRTSLLARVLAGLFALSCLLPAVGFGQGVTTGTLTGFVVDASGQPLAGATVTAVHTPTNTTFTATTGGTGRFLFTGIPVGGPYSVTARLSGYAIKPITNVQATLGESTDVMLVGSPAAAEQIVQLEKFEVTASETDLDANAAGASTVLSNQRLTLQPTVNRSFADLARTNPFTTIRAGSQIEALGMNNRYNSITLDGAKINDVFGLASSGLFSLNNPFSLDAIEQFSVSLTPYDVRQSGFAGAAINAVSKSGTNQFHGTSYFLFTDAKWQGKDISGTTAGTRPPLKERVYGFTFGGPILRDRLFFFMNYERYFRDSAPITPIYVPDPAFISAVNARAAQLPGTPSFGTFGGASTSRLADTKRLLKVDWNITKDHRLMVRYSDTIGAQPNTGSIASTSFSQPASFPSTVQPTSFPNGVTGLSSNFYTLDVKEKVWAAQLFSNWTSDLKTQLSYSHTQQDSVRDIPTKFPEIHIFNVPGTASNGSAITSGDAFRFGSEISSMGNELHIKDQTLSGSGDYVWNQFTFTAGSDYESTDFYNLFRQGSYGVFAYQNLAAFQSDTPSGFLRSVVQSGLPVADISRFKDTGVFGQVKWTPTPRFNATLGLRMDYIGSPIAPTENTAFKNAFGITNAGTVDGTHNIAPRFSFNYAVDQDRLMQVRGGLGVFLGRNPWVWISNSYGNTGVGRFVQVLTGSATPTLTQYLSGTYPGSSDPAYKFDAANPVGTTNTTGTASSINLIKPGMKLPTIERGNLAIDRKLPFLDATLTIESIYTEQLDALFVDNMNLTPTGRGIDGRQLFAGNSTSKPLVPGFANVIRTRDVHAGKSLYTSIVLDRPMKNNWAYDLAYTHGHATEAQTLNSSTANSQWQFNPVFNQNTVEVSRSDYEITDKVQALLSRRFRFGRYATTASLYYEGRTGLPYSYVYSNDLNGDGFGNNDLVAVPSGLNDPRFDFSGMTTQQQQAYLGYIQASGLGKFAGSYASRDAFSTPWQNRLDLQVEQEIPTYRKLKLKLFANFVNFGSFIARGLFNYVDELNTSPTNGGLTRALGSASYGADGRIKPSATVDSAGNLVFASSSTIIPNNGESRWKIEAGVHLEF